MKWLARKIWPHLRPLLLPMIRELLNELFDELLKDPSNGATRSIRRNWDLMRREDR